MNPTSDERPSVTLQVDGEGRKFYAEDVVLFPTTLLLDVIVKGEAAKHANGITLMFAVNVPDEIIRAGMAELAGRIDGTRHAPTSS